MKSPSHKTQIIAGPSANSVQLALSKMSVLIISFGGSFRKKSLNTLEGQCFSSKI